MSRGWQRVARSSVDRPTRQKPAHGASPGSSRASVTPRHPNLRDGLNRRGVMFGLSEDSGMASGRGVPGRQPTFGLISFQGLDFGLSSAVAEAPSIGFAMRGGDVGSSLRAGG